MKKLLIVPTCIIILFFYACSKKANPKPSTQVTINAHWYLNHTNYWRNVNGMMSQITETTNADTNNFIQFNTDGSGLNSAGPSHNYSLTYFRFTKSGSILTFIESNKTAIDTIKTLDANHLTFRDVFKTNFGGQLT